MGEARQVIIGNSAAGLSAVKAIREVNHSCPITLISAENCNAYSPVLLTYYLKGAISREHLSIVDSDFYQLNHINTAFGSRAVDLDALKQVVYLESGDRVEYDKLLIATGASPIKLGEGLSNVFSLRSIEDAKRISVFAKGVREVVVIGAGLIGLQVCDALFRNGTKFTIIEAAVQVFPENLDSRSAAMVQKKIESYGILILLGRKVRELKKEGKKAVAISESGEEWVADMVVVGVGLRPNSQFVQNSGIKVNRGILVDEFMRTNIGNVFAAGDVSEGMSMVSGEKEVLATWSNACRQGRIAGLNMAGGQQSYQGGLRETITTIFGMNLASVGLSSGLNDEIVEELTFFDPERTIYRKILLIDNKIVGGVFLGRIDDVGIIENFIRNRVDISPWKGKIAGTPLTARELLPSTANR